MNRWRFSFHLPVLLLLLAGNAAFAQQPGPCDPQDETHALIHAL